MTRIAHGRLGVSAVLAIVACGGDGAGPTLPPALAITAMTPAADATDVETGATVAVVFNQAIDPATLTAASFRATDKDVPLPGVVSYDPATRTARATGAFLPGRSYGAEVTTAVRTPADSGLPASQVWSFTTRAWQAIAVDNGFLYSSLALDASGRMHVSYYDIGTTNLKYATCTVGCDAVAGWQAVTVDSADAVGHYNSLAVDASGRLHISYYDFGNADLKYATCAAGCAAAAGWQTVRVDSVGLVGEYSSLAVEAGGRVHITYYHPALDLKYATCAAGCNAAAGWLTGTVAADAFHYASLAVDAGGRLHLSYLDGNNERLKYATCAAGCEAADAWQAVTVDAAALVGRFSSLAMDGSGRLHVSYYDGSNQNLKYATCAAGCDAVAGWQVATVDVGGAVGQYTSLAVDGYGRVHVSYYDAGTDDLRYATCAAGCDATAGWQTAMADSTGNVGQHSSIAVDASGRVHISHYDATNQHLKYTQ